MPDTSVLGCVARCICLVLQQCAWGWQELNWGDRQHPLPARDLGLWKKEGHRMWHRWGNSFYLPLCSTGLSRSFSSSVPSHLVQWPCLAWNMAYAVLAAAYWWHTSTRSCQRPAGVTFCQVGLLVRRPNPFLVPDCSLMCITDVERRLGTISSDFHEIWWTSS